MRGRASRKRQLLLTLALLLAGAGVRHAIELRARRLTIAERGPVAALPPPRDPPDADVLPAVGPEEAEPAAPVAGAEAKAPAPRTGFTDPTAEFELAEPRVPLVSASTAQSSAARSLSGDSDGPTTAARDSDPRARPVSPSPGAEPSTPSPPAPPVADDADSQSPRQFPAELQEQAANSPAGWVYEIEPGYDRSAPVSPEQIIGAWRIDAQGSPTGEFVANSLYRPSVPKRRWRRKPDR